MGAERNPVALHGCCSHKPPDSRRTGAKLRPGERSERKAESIRNRSAGIGSGSSSGIGSSSKSSAQFRARFQRSIVAISIRRQTRRLRAQRTGGLHVRKHPESSGIHGN
ncbi:hypothetical protein KR038_004723 [Drosophila bunnanda]|nr:hypothetical protein KR038_004723 [Drosophila bunnanda]